MIERKNSFLQFSDASFGRNLSAKSIAFAIPVHNSLSELENGTKGLLLPITPTFVYSQYKRTFYFGTMDSDYPFWGN